MQCEQDGCEQLARFHYTWPWGASGLVCSLHHFTVQQTAENLQRAVVFSPLAAGTPEPISRDERVRFHATILTMEDELRDARARGLELYNSNTTIAEQARRYASRSTELEAQMKDARADVETARAERDHYLDQVAEMRAEIETLKAILPPPAPEDDFGPGEPPPTPEEH
jgi:hypothetical protein